MIVLSLPFQVCRRVFPFFAATVQVELPKYKKTTGYYSL